jgi:hypothetical protein
MEPVGISNRELTSVRLHDIYSMHVISCMLPSEYAMKSIRLIDANQGVGYNIGYSADISWSLKYKACISESV